jgi:hypothetical protein
MCKLLATLLFICVCAASAHAITVAPLSFRQLVDEASVVVYGRVAEVRGQWTDDRQGIDSLVRLDALQVIKGRAGEQITFRTPGGEAGGRIHLLPGAPSFHEGDLVLVFLGAAGAAYPTIVGLTQGVFRVMPHPANGSLMVVAPPVETARQAPGPIARGDARRRPMTLEAFGAEVRASMEQLAEAKHLREGGPASAKRLREGGPASPERLRGGGR